MSLAEDAGAGAGRRIMLRRPPVMHVAEGPFVPEHPRVAEVDERWAAFRERVPAAFDGRVMHVFGVHRNGHGGVVMHLVETAYRYYAVQAPDFDLGVRPLGANGITWRDGRVLMGRRAAWVAGYPGAWEFAPGGVVEPGESPARTVVRELREETGGRGRPRAGGRGPAARCAAAVLGAGAPDRGGGVRRSGFRRVRRAPLVRPGGPAGAAEPDRGRDRRRRAGGGPLVGLSRRIVAAARR